MGRKIKFAVVFVIVFVAGGLAGVVLSAVIWQRNIVSPFYNMELLGIAIDAQQLSKGKAEEVLKRKVMVIPSITQAYYNHFYKFMPDSNERYTSLWQVQRYYEISGENIPAEIKPILDSLPKRPLTSCELKRIKDGNSPAADKPK